MSKANQAFKQNDEGVSPVIGVILMVAITVVLAAVVFVLVSNLGKGSEKAPNLSINKDSAARTLTVVQADAGVNWNDFTIGGSCATSATTPLTWTLGNGESGTFAQISTWTVSGGDVLSGCDAGESLTITHLATNSLIYSTTFS